MGGSAFLLFGSIDPILLEKREIKQTLFQKIFGIKKYTGPTETKMNDNYSLMSINNHGLGILEKIFKKYLLEAIPNPNTATKQFMDYINIKTITIYLRGNKKVDKTEWYVQITFSGCAGMSETSAALGSHWAELWINKERNKITEILAKNGFIIDENRNESEKNFFIPFDKYGYAKVLNENEIDDEIEGSKYFEIDQAVLESLSDEEQTLLSKLDNKYYTYVNNKICHCQICDPNFIPLKE